MVRVAWDASKPRKILENHGVGSEEEKKKGCRGKDLQKKKVLSLE